MTRLVLASSNQGKLAEIQPLLEGSGYVLVRQRELGVSDAIEDGKTFVENALIKARHACTATGLPALADDSGIVVDALDGAPGLLSARYAGEHGDAGANNRKLLEALRGVPEAKRTARFVAVIVLLRHADDPLFFDPVLGRGAAELEPGLKNRVSHRGQALQQLRRLLSC